MPYSPPSTTWVLRALLALLCRNMYAWASPAVSAVNAVCGPDPSDTSSAATPAVSPAKGLGGRPLVRASSTPTPTPTPTPTRTRMRISGNGGDGAGAVQQRRAARALGAYDGTSPSPASRRAIGAAVQPVQSGRRPAWWDDFELASPRATAAAADDTVVTKTAKGSSSNGNAADVQSPSGSNEPNCAAGSPQDAGRQPSGCVNGVRSPHLGDLPLHLVRAAEQGEGLCNTSWCSNSGYR